MGRWGDWGQPPPSGAPASPRGRVTPEREQQMAGLGSAFQMIAENRARVERLEQRVFGVFRAPGPPREAESFVPAGGGLVPGIPGIPGIPIGPASAALAVGGLAARAIEAAPAPVKLGLSFAGIGATGGALLMGPAALAAPAGRFFKGLFGKRRPTASAVFLRSGLTMEEFVRRQALMVAER